MRWAACCTVFAVLLALLCVNLPRLAVDLVFHSLHPPPGSPQSLYVPSPASPDLHLNLVRGMPTTAFITDRRIDELERDFKHREGDVWVVTYQKSGTGWSQRIVSLINRLQTDSESPNFCPWPEVEIGFLKVEMEELNAGASRAGPPRCFKSHWPRRDHMARLPHGSKTLVVIRNAADVVESYYHHCLAHYGNYKLDAETSFEAFFEMFLRGDAENGDYFEHLGSWWEVRDDPGVLIVRYEDLKAKHLETVQRIARFVSEKGEDLDAARLADIVRLSSAEYLHSIELSDPTWKVMRWLGVVRGSFVRAGDKTHRRTILVTAAMRARLVERYEAVLRPRGVPIDFVVPAA